MSKFSIPYLYNPGVLIGQISPFLNESIKKTIGSESVIAGTSIQNIKESYETPYIPELWKYIDDMFYVWKREFCVEAKNHKIFDVRTNYMKTGEFIPTHDYNGFASFVLWVQIPFKAEDEIKYKHDNCGSGTFEFVYSTMSGSLKTHRIQNDKSDEGVVLMFPSKLQHCVYPFYTSDDVRITIAGNIIAEGRL